MIADIRATRSIRKIGRLAAIRSVAAFWLSGRMTSVRDGPYRLFVKSGLAAAQRSQNGHPWYRTARAGTR